MVQGARESGGFELAPRGRLAVGCLHLPRAPEWAGGRRAGHARPVLFGAHTCARESLWACFSGALETLVVDAEQSWAVCLETAVSLLSHDFAVAAAR